jgi:hypothetical protein
MQKNQLISQLHMNMIKIFFFVGLIFISSVHSASAASDDTDPSDAYLSPSKAHRFNLACRAQASSLEPSAMKNIDSIIQPSDRSVESDPVAEFESNLKDALSRLPQSTPESLSQHVSCNFTAQGSMANPPSILGVLKSVSQYGNTRHPKGSRALVPTERDIGSKRHPSVPRDLQVLEGTYATSNTVLMTSNLRTCACLAIAALDIQLGTKSVFLTHVNQMVKHEALSAAVARFVHGKKILKVRYWRGREDEKLTDQNVTTIHETILNMTKLDKASAEKKYSRGSVNRADIVGMSAEGQALHLRVSYPGGYYPQAR